MPMAVDMLRRWTRSTDAGGLSHGGSASPTTNLTFGGTQAGRMGLKLTPITSAPWYASLTPKRQDQLGRSFMFLTGLRPDMARHGSRQPDMDLHVSLASLVGLGTHYQLPSFRCRSKIQDGLRAVRGRQM